MTDLVVHGLGYVGLTAAVHFAQASWRVLGYDPDLAVASGINLGVPRVGDCLSYLGVDVEALVTAGLFAATSDYKDVVDSQCLVHLIAVPTEKEGKPYDAIVLAVLRQLFQVVTHSQPITVLVESTLTPGTIDRFLKEYPLAGDILEAGSALAVCPRRDWFADPQKNLATLPRVVGGVTLHSTQRAVKVLRDVSLSVLPTDYRTAELTKAVENALFHIPVVFLHQLAYALPHHDMVKVAELVTTHWRFESFGRLYLGFGTGGRCVPLGTEYLMAAAAGPHSYGPLTIGKDALYWDECFREIIADVVMRGMSPGRPHAVLVLGVAYRPGFRDAGRSAALGVSKQLARHQNIIVNIHDPMWTAVELSPMAEAVGAGVVSPLPNTLEAYDAVLLATPHQEYLDLPAVRNLWRSGQLVLDSQGAWRHYKDRLESYGVKYRRVGEPGWVGV